MFESVPTVLSQTGLEFRIQHVEISGGYVLIRIRCDVMRPTGHGGTERPAVMGEWFTLTDERGGSVQMAEMNAAGSGPFAGIVDLAFPLQDELNLDAPITLTSGNSQVVIQLPTAA
jgi:hypothetical protein